jgi:MFS family permease
MTNVIPNIDLATRRAPLSRMFRGATGLVFILLCAMYFIEYVDRVNLSVAGPLIRKEMHLSNIQLGIAFSAFGYCYAATQLLGGYLGDRIGSRLSLTILGLIWACGTFATGLAGGLAFLVAARFLVGLGEAGTLPSATRVITTWVPKTRRGFAQGATHAAARAAAAITPLIMVALIDWRGWRAAFYVVGGVSLVWVACWFLYFRNDPRRHSGVTPAELAELPPFQENVQRVSAVPWSRLIRRMMPVTIVFFCHAWTLWLYLTWLPSFFHDTYHMDLKHSAIFTSVAFLGGMIGDVMGGLLTDGIYRRTGNLTQARRNVVICAFLGSLLCLGVMLIWHDEIIVALALSASLFFLEMAEAPVWSVPSDVAARYAGIAGGILSTAAGVAAIVSPLAFGIISQVTGSDVLPFLLSILLLMLGIVVSFWIRADVPLADS